ncbi:MAG: hypothetical protein SGPRY_006062, partial [Prymnesium sp.]
MTSHRGSAPAAGIACSEVACSRLLMMQQCQHQLNRSSSSSSSRSSPLPAQDGSDAAREPTARANPAVPRPLNRGSMIKRGSLSTGTTSTTKGPVTRRKKRSIFTLAIKRLARRKSSHSTDAAVQQAQGLLGNAQVIDEETVLPVRILIYRLVSLNPRTPWGDGLLLELARETEDDQLEETLQNFLENSWREDPVRKKMLSGGVLQGERKKSWRQTGLPAAIKAQKSSLPALRAASKFAQ